MSLALLLKPPIRAKFLEAGSDVTSPGILTLDASIEEVHSLENAITQFPVEKGIDIADNVVNQPRRLEITGEVSDTPVEFFGFVSPPGQLSPTVTSWDTIQQLWRNRQPFDVVTAFKVYRNMMIESSVAPRNRSVGRKLVFTASLREIEIVSTEPTLALIDDAMDLADLGRVMAQPPDAVLFAAASAFLIIAIGAQG